ncbi:helix-turn-helix domain-containing protein [Actinosynnema sp. NPDC020468]|uniref:helix-turn-helix domain-containing protein n=1 Tax=Actinosynnema sp. NPDC020468 TaxID=3154488 RepID=UPI0033F0FF18
MRLSRAQAQDRNRAKVLAAAREEFAERGFREAKVDAIAERAELTRGAVYSNFPGKRALYFAVLAEEAVVGGVGEPGLSAREAMGAFARSWVSRLPLSTDDRRWLAADLVPEVLSDEVTRRAFGPLTHLGAILLGLALEGFGPGRAVRVAEAALTTLHGASTLAAAAPGFGEPFNVVRACEQLVDLDLGDEWGPVPIVAEAFAVDEPWAAGQGVDLVTGEPVELGDDGVVSVLGTRWLASAEQPVRLGLPTTVVVVTDVPAELNPLARLAVADVAVHLRGAFPRSIWPRLRVVVDDGGALAARAGVRHPDGETEVAVRVRGGRVVARAEGRGAGHAVGTLRVAKRTAGGGEPEDGRGGGAASAREGASREGVRREAREDDTTEV